MVGLGGFGNHKEEFGGGDNDVSTDLAEVVLLHALLYGEGREVGVEFAEGGYGEAVCSALALGGEAVEFVDIAAGAYDLDAFDAAVGLFAGDAGACTEGGYGGAYFFLLPFLASRMAAVARAR